jgi:ABC-type branched-subunit amino acid transport system substrate-binding protein
LKRLKLIAVLSVLAGLLIAGCGGRSNDTASDTSSGGSSTTAAPTGGADCAKEKPKATEVGVSADTITVEVMADVGSSLAPGLFQGNHDALEAYAKYINANGGIACRKLVAKLWDTKLSPDESKNGLIDACTNAVALVGNNALFNPDVSPMETCKDKAGAATGLPDVAALANDIHEQCSKLAFLIQAVPEKCETLTGERELTAYVGMTRYLVEHNGDLHGLFMVPGDLPTTVQSATYQIKAQTDAGVRFDSVLKISGRAEQAAYTPLVQQVKAAKATYVYNGSLDRAMVAMRKEAKAQGVDSVKVWACSLACYTRNFLATGGADVEGTYTWMQFLPFEEADSNAALKAYVDAVGPNKVDSFGAQAWQAAMLFKHAVDQIVKTDGVNGITRAKLLDALRATDDFTADGWMGKEPKDLRGFSPCMVILQVKDGKFVRVFPEKKGTLDCNAADVVHITLDPAKEAEKIT